ncbi:hypothetical protein JOC36_001150 [Weissella uvarum]|uniref:hypothetical protein n=1 Tax=Weissella uvarum TaxID=1479233 RepID=UPI00195FC750|nr:hypothetical protein [Weissella uvarum]MBM7617588.1 hypothetical protein [Weissella uvarum]MCM0595940.1 hypothetical protein [Weissella uvarum]
MVKQGKFASSERQKQVQNKNRKPKNQTATIEADQALDFLLVRYHLVSKQSSLVEETNSRFIQEFMQLGMDNPWSLAEITLRVLQQVDVNVPWQFYQILFDHWEQTKHFILKEVPAIPLINRINIMDDLSTEELQNAIVDKLAMNWFINQFKGVPDKLGKVTDQQIKELAKGLKQGSEIDWNKVAELNRSIVSGEVANVDAGTQAWLDALKNM